MVSSPGCHRRDIPMPELSGCWSGEKWRETQKNSGVGTFG
jgi:hypothetical protein